MKRHHIVFVDHTTQVRVMSNIVPFENPWQAEELCADLNRALIRNRIHQGFYAVTCVPVQNKIGIEYEGAISGRFTKGGFKRMDD